MRGLNLVFVSRPQTPADITATLAWGRQVLVAWGGAQPGEPQGVWVFARGKKVGELESPPGLDQPVEHIVAFGQWIVAAARTRIEVWKADSLEHYTTIFTMGAADGGNDITGGVTTLPTFLNKIFVGRRDGWVEIWNVSTGRLVYTILPPSRDCGAVTCLEPSPVLALLAIAYSEGPLVIHNVLTDNAVLRVNAGSPLAPVLSISFRTDGAGAGHDGRKEGVMATATGATGDVTFWDLNEGGRVMGVLRSAHNPPSRDGTSVKGGLSRVQFLPGQAVVVTSGRDNALRTWIFDDAPFSPVPRVLHTRSGHAGAVNCLHFLPTDFDGAEAGNKWLLSGGRDRSLWGWSLRRDGQSAELSQGNMRKKAKKYGLLSSNALAHGPTTSLEDIKAPEITCVACSLNRDGGMGAIPGKQPIWQQRGPGGARATLAGGDAEASAATGWESVVTAHKNDRFARTWFWGRKRAGRWALKTGDDANVSTVAVSSCGTFALVGSEGGAIDMYNLQSGQHRRKFPSRLTPAQARQVKMLQLKQADSAVRLHDEAASGSARFAPGTGKHAAAVTGLAVDPLNKTLVSCGRDGKIKFWDFATGTLVHETEWLVPVLGCRSHASNDLVAFSCEDGSVRVVDSATRRTIREFHSAGGAAVNDFCFSADGRWLLVAAQDALVRVFDLPTGHLVDAIRLPKPCRALAVSNTGEYLAAVVDGQMGVGLWTNRAMFRHVPTRQISERAIAETAAPTVSGEGGQGLLEAALEGDDEGEDVADGALVPSVDQLSVEMMTLSVVPRARWQTLVHLDLIKQRNKPTEAPKKPEQAPFFLPSLGGGKRAPDGDNEGEGEGQTKKAAQAPETRITKLDRARAVQAFAQKLADGGATGDCESILSPHTTHSTRMTCILILSPRHPLYRTPQVAAPLGRRPGAALALVRARARALCAGAHEPPRRAPRL
jgi:U3 small nucleolar RNA-associated protein 21